jgi:hypothetical protein
MSALDPGQHAPTRPAHAGDAAAQRIRDALQRVKEPPEHRVARQRTAEESSALAQLGGVVLGRSLGEEAHGSACCNLGGRPHLGPCVEPGSRTAGTFVNDEWEVSRG